MIDDKALEAAMLAAQDADIDPYGTDWAVVIPAAIEAYERALWKPVEEVEKPCGTSVLATGGTYSLVDCTYPEDHSAEGWVYSVCWDGSDWLIESDDQEKRVIKPRLFRLLPLPPQTEEGGA